MRKVITIVFSLCYISIILLCYLFSTEKNYFLQTNKDSNLPEISNNLLVTKIATLKNDIYNHASSVTKIGDTLFATWYSGSKEASHNTNIMFTSAKKTNDHWQFSKPKTIMNADKYQAIFKKGIHHLGNPSILSQGNRIWLFFSSSSGGWATSSLNIIYSDNYGETWSSPKPILNSPIFNYSTLTRGAAVLLTNDGFALPVYKEFNNLAGRWLVFNKDGQLINISEMTTNGVTLQPTVVPLSKEHAIAYYREMSSSKKKIYTNESFDAGKTWTTGNFTKLNNPDAGISALKVKDGIVLAYNNSTKDRLNLSLAYKRDGSSKWRNIYTFPNKDKHLLAYPTLIADRENLLLSFSNGHAGETNIDIVEIKGEQ
ncbi:exo-alpha-sialidase [Francisellaceae bacterium CB299]|jgi:predicted neuraminidase